MSLVYLGFLVWSAAARPTQRRMLCRSPAETRYLGIGCKRVLPRHAMPRAVDALTLPASSGDSRPLSRLCGREAVTLCIELRRLPQGPPLFRVVPEDDQRHPLALRDAAQLPDARPLRVEVHVLEDRGGVG